jgi:hypothetical protein
MKNKIIVCFVLIAMASIWSACNCDNVQNKLIKLNPKQIAFFEALKEGYQQVSFKSSNGQIINFDFYVNFDTNQGELLKQGACPIYREFIEKNYNYSSYGQYGSDDIDIDFSVSSKNQPGILQTEVNQNFFFSLDTDLHDLGLVKSSSMTGSNGPQKGYFFIGDTTLNGKSYSDVYHLPINKLPTSLSTEIKDIYISFSKGLVGFTKVNGISWVLE